MQIRIETFLYPDNGKKTEPETVEYKQGDFKFIFNGFENHRDNCGNENYRTDDDVVHPENGYVQKKIAHCTAAYRRYKCDNKNTERIESFLHRCKCARRCKRNSTEDFYE